MSGTGLWLGEPAAAQAVQARGLDSIEASTGEVLSATAGSAWAGSIGPRVWDWAARTFAPPSPTLQPDEANTRYGIPGALTFDRPVSEATAQALREGREAEQRRQAIIARRGDSLLTSGVGRGVVAFATAAVDPINVGAALIPFVREARMMQLMGTTSITAGRAAAGAVGGAAGMAVLEPAEYALGRAEFNDRTMAETLGAIAFGTVLGGGLHVLGGAVVDAVRGRTPVERALAQAAPGARETMLRGAVAAVAEGRPVEVGAVMNLPTATTYREVAGEARQGAYAAYTPGGLRIEARPEVVDLSALVPSHMADGTVNAAYPHAEGLQPRDRSTAGSQDQIGTIAANLQPERLGPSPEAGAGAPLVDTRGVVESGNGRVAALERVYSNPELAHRAQAYRAYLEAQGYDLTGIERPVLVGRRVSDLSPQEAAAFAKGANERPNLSMTAAEQARADADRAGRAITDLQPGQLTSSQNRDFTRAFLAQLPAEERGSLVLADGRLSAAGELRMRQAILAHSFGDSLGPLLEKLLNGEAENLKGIAGALADTAGPWGRMRAAAARGEIPADLDITAALGEAVQLVEKARSSGKSIAELLAQTDAFTAPPGPATLALLRLMHRDENLARTLGREPLAELLTRYSDEAMKVQPGPDLFGTPPASPADLLRAAARHVDPAAATAQALDDLARAPRAAPEDVLASREAARMAEQPKASPYEIIAPEPMPPPPALTREMLDATDFNRNSEHYIDGLIDVFMGNARIGDVIKLLDQEMHNILASSNTWGEVLDRVENLRNLNRDLEMSRAARFFMEERANGTITDLAVLKANARWADELERRWASQDAASTIEGQLADPPPRQLQQPAAKPSTRPVDPETARATAEADAMIKQLERLPLSPEERAQLERLRTLQSTAETEARATEAAAICMTGLR